jgi:predicted site-specific integrase-resolvase
MPKTYRIGELASHLSVAIETIRYYEKEGLLPQPARSEATTVSTRTPSASDWNSSCTAARWT